MKAFLITAAVLVALASSAQDSQERNASSIVLPASPASTIAADKTIKTQTQSSIQNTVQPSVSGDLRDTKKRKKTEQDTPN